MPITKLQLTEEVTTVGNDKISVQADSASTDYFVLTMNNTALKMSQQDLLDVQSMLNRCTNIRVSVK